MNVPPTIAILPVPASSKLAASDNARFVTHINSRVCAGQQNVQSFSPRINRRIRFICRWNANTSILFTSRQRGQVASADALIAPNRTRKGLSHLKQNNVSSCSSNSPFMDSSWLPVSWAKDDRLLEESATFPARFAHPTAKHSYLQRN